MVCYQCEEMDCHRCSLAAGDSQGGCLNFKNGICRPISVFQAKECVKYIPVLGIPEMAVVA